MTAGPVQAFTKENVKARWAERYSSDAINKKFLGLPRGVYLGFVPSQSGLTLSLKPDIVVTYTGLSGAFAVGDTITGGGSGTTAVVRVIGVGYVLVDSVVGPGFTAAETITGGAGSATVSTHVSEGISLGRVVSSSPLMAGRSEHMLDVYTTDTINLNFTGFGDGAYYVILTADYAVGATTVGTISSRTSPPPSGAQEVLICVATKSGASLSVAATAPTTRHEPYAFDGARIGFMPGGAIDQLILAITASQEIVAARQLSDGTTAPAFNPATPQTTGLPYRLNYDLSNVGMGPRLGKQLITVKGNSFTLSGSVGSVNVSGSFAARNRDNEPYKDQSPSNSSIPAGVPSLINPNGSEFVDLELTGVSGTFSVGKLVTGADSGSTAIVKAFNTPVLSLGDFVGSFFVGEAVSQTSPSGGGVISSIDLREGVITAASAGAAENHIVTIIDNSTGNKPINADAVRDNLVFGRLVYGAGGSGNPGEHTLTATLSFSPGSQTVNVVSGTVSAPGDIEVGDIIEGADGRYYEVNNVSSLPTSFDIDPVKDYLGPGTSAANLKRHRFYLYFRRYSSGVETASTLAAGSYTPYFPTWFTTEKSNLDTVRNVGSTGQLPAIRVRNTGTVTGSSVGVGSTSGLAPILNVYPGSGISVAVNDDAATGTISITITNASPGGGGPSPGSATSPDIAGGIGGGSSNYARADHQHTLSSAYATAGHTHTGLLRVKSLNLAGTTDTYTIPMSGDTPLVAIFVGGNASSVSAVGIAVGLNASDQVGVIVAAGSPTGVAVVPGEVFPVGGSNGFAVTEFDTTNVKAFRSGGSVSVYAGRAVVIGQA